MNDMQAAISNYLFETESADYGRGDEQDRAIMQEAQNALVRAFIAEVIALSDEYLTESITEPTTANEWRRYLMEVITHGRDIKIPFHAEDAIVGALNVVSVRKLNEYGLLVASHDATFYQNVKHCWYSDPDVLHDITGAFDWLNPVWDEPQTLDGWSIQTASVPATISVAYLCHPRGYKWGEIINKVLPVQTVLGLGDWYIVADS